MDIVERNKELVRAFQENVMHKEDYTHADRYLHEDLVVHIPPGMVAPGRDNAVAWFKQAAGWFICRGIDEKLTMADEDTVFQLIELHFEHTGHYMGLPPTGKRFSIAGLAAFKIRDGKISEHWGLYDMASIPAQLGIEMPDMAGM